MLILPLCEVRSLFGVMTFVQHRKCILAARNRLHLREKNSMPLLFLQFGLPKPRYARFWQLSNLRKSNFAREFFSLRATCFWLLRTYILYPKGIKKLEVPILLIGAHLWKGKVCMRKTGRMQIESRVEAEIRLEGWLDMDLSGIKFTFKPSYWVFLIWYV